MSPYALLITSAIAYGIWFALEKAGMRKWPAFALMFALILGTAVVAQFIIWPGKY